MIESDRVSDPSILINILDNDLSVAIIGKK